MTKKNQKIALVHNKVMPYRKPFFEKLSDNYKIDFLIFDEKEIDADINFYILNKREIYNKILNRKYDIVVNPDVSFPEAWVSTVAARRINAHVVQWTEIWDMPNQSVYHRITKPLLFRALDRWIDSYIVPGFRSKEYVLNHTAAKATEIHRVPNASHINNKESTNVSREQLGIKSEGKVILHLSQLSHRKGIDTLLRAANRLEQRLDDLVILIAGEGNKQYKKKLEELSNRLGLTSVRFLGWVEQSKICDIYNISDVYVLLSRNDPYPLSVIEAMLCGTPTVVSKGVGQAYDIVRDQETGAVVHSEDPDEAAQALIDILTYDQKRTEMAKRAREIVCRSVTYKHMIDGFDRAIN